MLKSLIKYKLLRYGRQQKTEKEKNKGISDVIPLARYDEHIDGCDNKLHLQLPAVERVSQTLLIYETAERSSLDR